MATGRNNFHLGVSSCSICQSNFSFLKDERSFRLTKSFPRTAPIKHRTFGLVSMNRLTISEPDPKRVGQSKIELVKQQEKLQLILSELRDPELKIDNATKQRLIRLLSDNLDAYGAIGSMLCGGPPVPIAMKPVSPADTPPVTSLSARSNILPTPRAQNVLIAPFAMLATYPAVPRTGAGQTPSVSESASTVTSIASSLVKLQIAGLAPASGSASLATAIVTAPPSVLMIAAASTATSAAPGTRVLPLVSTLLTGPAPPRTWPALTRS